MWDRKRARGRATSTCGIPPRNSAVAALGIAALLGQGALAGGPESARAGTPLAPTADSPAPAVTPPADSESLALMRAVQDRYARIRDLRGTFEQQSFTAALGTSDSAAGRVVVERPGKMRWEYHDGRVIVLADTSIRVYNPEDNQLQVAALTPETVSPTALSFLLGESRLDAEFTAKAVPAAGRDALGLELVPRSGDTSFQSLVLWVDPKTHALRESVVVDLFGNRTALTLRDIVENAGTKPADFALEVPEGTDVIDLR